MPFLVYINYPTPGGIIKWVFTLVTINATNVWQIGYISNQNGCWKMAVTVEKDALLIFKNRHEFESTYSDQPVMEEIIFRKGQELGINC